MKDHSMLHRHSKTPGTGPIKTRDGNAAWALSLALLQIAQPLLLWQGNVAQAAEVVPTTAGVTLDQAVNGVPIVNIAAPGAAGVSHNHYAQFDVGTNGLILNNSGQPVNTRLGGFILGNGNLGGGAARLIVNEVTGARPSQLNGYMEVAGPAAGVVVANPYGITCRGCGFINTPQATLSTGKPLLASDGSLTGFSVEAGTLTLEGNGLNASNTERLALYTRALELNAALYARDLQIVTGSNTITVNDAVGTASVTALNPALPAPAYALDSSALGGMYANSIRLIGTEAGLGMRLAGPVAALTGRLEIQSNGDVRLARASAEQAMVIKASTQLQLTDQVTAGTNVDMQAADLALASSALLTGHDININVASMSTATGSQIAARGALQLNADSLTNAGSVASADSMTLATHTWLNSGTLQAQHALNVHSDSIDNSGAGSIGSGGALNITAASLGNAGTITSADALLINASGQINNSGQIEAKTAASVSAQTLRNSGQLQLSNGVMSVNIEQALDNHGGSIRHTGSTFELSAASLDNHSGTLASAGIFNLQLTGSTALNNSMGLLQGNTALSIRNAGSNTVNINNAGGQLLSNGALELELNQGALDNRNNGLIETTGSIALNHASALLNSDGMMRAGANLSLNLPSFDRTANGGSYAAAGLLALHTSGAITMNGADFKTPGGLWLDAGNASIQIDSRLEAGATTTLNANSIALGDNGFLATQGTLTASANDLNNLGVMYGRDGITLHIDNILDNGRAGGYQAAAILSNGNINISNALDGKLVELNNYGGQIETLDGDISIKAELLTNQNVGWALSTPWNETLTPVYTDNCPHAYCSGHVAQVIWRDGNILYESGFYWPRDAKAYENIWLTKTATTITHYDILDRGHAAFITANAPVDSARGNIHLELGTLDNDRSHISAANDLHIKAATINNTATVVHDSSRAVKTMRYKECPHSGGCWMVGGPTIETSGDLAARTDQIISSVLEGKHVYLYGTTIHNKNDGQAGETINSAAYITPQGPWANIPAAGPGGAAVSGAINLGVLDPTTLPGFHLPGDGVFHLHGDPSHPYLIETDPALNTYNGFLGSGYLINHLDWQPGSTQRRLGDSYYEITLIREMLLASIGSRFIDQSIADEKAQYEYLLQNAIAASEALQLSPGISLSRAQIDALQADIVWMEEREVAGQKVLVPVVYLAQGSSRILHDGAVIGGGSLSIEGDSFSNSGLVRAHDSIQVNTSGDINNLGGHLQAGGNLVLQSGGDILNESGQLSGRDVLLQAEGDIINRTTSIRDEQGSGDNTSWSTRVGDTARITAAGNLAQIAGGDIRLEAAVLTGNNIALAAGKSITLGAVQVAQGYKFNGGDWQQAEAYVRHLQTQIDASQNLSMSAGRDITAMAASIKAGGDVSLDAGRSINLLAVEDSDHRESHTQSSGAFTDKTHDVVDDATRTQGTSIISGGNLSLNARGGDITLYASSAQAGGTADVRAEGNLNILAGVNTTSHSEQSSKSSSATFNNHNEGFIEQSAAASSISSKGNLTLNAGNDINLVASSLHSDATLRIGDTVVDQTTLLLPLPSGEGRGEGATNSSSVTTTLPHNLNIGTLTLTNESWNETQKGFSGPLEEIIKVASVYAGFLASGFAAGQVEMPEINIGSHDNSRTKDVLQAGSSLSAHDMHIRVQDTAAFIGAEVAVQGTLAVNAKNIVIDAAAETHSSSHDVGTDTVKGLGAQLDTDKGEVRVAGVQESKTSTSDTQSLTQWRGTKINAGQLILNAENNIDILGSQLNVLGDAVVQAGGDLTIGGREGEATQTHKETTETITVAAAVRNAYVDAGLAVKGLADATSALKDAKSALSEAERKVGLGQLDADDLNYFRANVVATAFNLAQAEVAATNAVIAMASTTQTGGMYATGSAQREKTVSTTTSTQSLWQGSSLSVGGNAALLAGNTLTVKGSDVGVANVLIVDAKKINLLAGVERSSETSRRHTDQEGASVSVNTSGVTGGSVSAGYQQSDADSSSVHYVNSHLSAGTLSSQSDALRIAGAVIEADHVDISTGKLTVVSLQDEAHSKSKSEGISAGIGFGNTETDKTKPAVNGVTSKSGSVDYQKSSSERLWVVEQSGIIGHDSISVSAEDTVLTGAIIAHAKRGELGELVDQGQLTLSTNTLTINDVFDVDKSKTIGASFGLSRSRVPADQSKGTESNGPLPSGAAIDRGAALPNSASGANSAAPATTTAAAAASAKPVPHNTTTVGATYLGHRTEQTTRATLGGGTIVVGGTTLNANNATELGLATLNRDVSHAQVITKNEDIGGLNATVTLDNRLLSPEGRAEMAREQKQAFGILGGGVLKGGAAVVSLVDQGDLDGAKIEQNAGAHATKNGQQTVNVMAIANGDASNVVDNQATLQGMSDALHQDVSGDAATVLLADNPVNKDGQIVKADADHLDNRITLNNNTLSGVVNSLAHENNHLAGGSETGSIIIGNLSAAAFSLSAWANSDSLSAYTPTPSFNLAGFNDAAAQQALLNRNNATHAAAVLDHPDQIEDSVLGDWAEEKALHASESWKSKNNWFAAGMRGFALAGAGAIAAIDTAANAGVMATQCGIGNASLCQDALADNQKFAHGISDSVVKIANGDVGSAVGEITFNFFNGDAAEQKAAQNSIITAATALWGGAALSAVGEAANAALKPSTSVSGGAVVADIAVETEELRAIGVSAKKSTSLNERISSGQTTAEARAGNSVTTHAPSEPPAAINIASNDLQTTPLYEGTYPEINFDYSASGLGEFDLGDWLGDGGSSAGAVSYDISRWGEYGLPSDGYFARTLNERQAFSLMQGKPVEFGGKPTEGYQNGMGFIGSAEEVRPITTGAEFASKLDLTYQPKYLLEFQLKDPAGLRNVLDAPYAEFVRGGETASGKLEWNYPGINSDGIVNWKLRELK